MNNRNNKNGKNSTNDGVIKKPFCKVCFDAKKPREVYESHWVRDREGNVTCITLNEQECRYCYKKGHTVKFCNEVARINKEREKVVASREREELKLLKQEKQKKVNAVETISKRGAFAMLDSDNESDDDVEVKVKEEWPQLAHVQVKESMSKKKLSFADALKTTEANYNAELVAKAEEKKEDKWTQLTRNVGNVTVVQDKSDAKLPELVKKTDNVKVNESKTNKGVVNSIPKRRCWADDTDSDTEDEDESYLTPIQMPNSNLYAYEDPTW